MTGSKLTVSQLAERIGSSSDTIRYYDKIGLLADVARNDVGHRRFDDEDVLRLRFIQRAKHFGLQLDQIRELLDVRDRGLCPCGHARDLLQKRRADITRQLRELRDLRRDIDRLLGGERAGDDAGWPCSGGDGLIQLQGRPPGGREGWAAVRWHPVPVPPR